MRTRPLGTLVLALTPLCFSSRAHAQVDPGDLPGSQVLREEARAQRVDRGPVTVSLVGSGKGIFQTGFESDNDAKIATSYAQAGATLTWVITDKLALNFGLGYEAAFYDMENAKDVFPQLDSDDPFDTLNSTAFAASGQWYFMDNWFVVGAATATAGWEPGAEFSDAWTYGGFGAVGYKFSDRFSLALGAGATTRLEDDALWFPYITLRWQATENMVLESEGLGLRFTATINKWFDVFLRGGYEGRSYRLDQDDTSAPNSALEDRGIFVSAGVAWKPLPNLRVSLEGGAVVDRELELRSSSGHKLSEEDTEVAPMLGLTVRYSF